MSCAQREPIVIGCAANARFVLPLAVTLGSALANLDPGCWLDVYAIGDNIEPNDQCKVVRSLKGRADVHWLRPQRSEFSGLPLWGRMSIVTYDKLALSQLLPSSVRKVIWLDSDLLVLGDLARLWAEDMGAYHALAAQDAIVPHAGSHFGIAGYRELGIGGNAGYFNAGVMVLNVALWRQDDIGGRALAYLKRYRNRVSFWDQEALNAVLVGKWRELDMRWNWNVILDRPGCARRLGYDERGTSRPEGDPWILHFTGSLKPWACRSRSARHTLYFQYVDRTLFAGWRPGRNWRSAALGLYESSPVRNVLYPAEQWITRLMRATTHRVIGDKKSLFSGEHS